jgi:hypothetical protein
VDPVTGISSRNLRLLAVIVVAGVVAATIATASPSDPTCPDERFGCATFQEGEAMVLGVLVTDDTAGDELAAAVRGAVAERGGELAGRRLRPFVWRTTCEAEGAAEGARQLATDPLDAPPTFAVIAATCPAATLPTAQILADSGRVLVSSTRPPLLTRNADTTLDASASAMEEGLTGLVSLVLDVAEETAFEAGGEVLIPRTGLLLALRDEGLPPAPHR